MTSRNAHEQHVWGAQHPFERNYLQRTITLAGLGAIFAVSIVLLVAEDVVAVLGVALIMAGLLVGLAALSRQRYVREAEYGFSILTTRGGSFVLWSAAACAAVGVLVVLVILG